MADNNKVTSNQGQPTDPILHDKDYPSPKKPKVEGESSVEPESSRTYEVIASQYFNQPGFFDTADANDFFNKKVTKWRRNEKKPHVLDLQALSVHEFYTKALESCPNDDKVENSFLQNFFHDNITVCDSQAVLDDYNQWKKESGIGIWASPRMVSVSLKIQDTKLSHTYDLDSFSKRIVELFHWWEKQNNEMKLVGPYLCFVQSSGMGKTKLMYEYNQRKVPLKENDDAIYRVVAKLILPACINDKDVKGLFDHELAVDKVISGCIKTSDNEDPARVAAQKVYDQLDEITKDLSNCKGVVLLFDESHQLLEKHFEAEAFLLRCICVWLREKRDSDQRIVGVFAGTNFNLSHFINESDDALKHWPRSSRGQQWSNRKYEQKGSEYIPPFYQTTTMGCRLASLPEDLVLTEYARAVYYGRPPFVVIAEDQILDDKISTVLTRMLLLDNKVKKWEANHNTFINILSTRVQMGQTTIAMTSDLVAKGYANLSGYFEETESAQLAYLPDPVCAHV